MHAMSEWWEQITEFCASGSQLSDRSSFCLAARPRAQARHAASPWHFNSDGNFYFRASRCNWLASAIGSCLRRPLGGPVVALLYGGTGHVLAMFFFSPACLYPNEEPFALQNKF